MNMRWQKVFEVQIEGIKCDNPTCDYKDNSVTIKEYESYLNRPCPKCGANLLTEKDFATVQGMLFMERLFCWLRYPTNKPKAFINVGMEGTGKIKIDKVEMEKK